MANSCVTCDSQVLYGLRRADFRPLNADGSPDEQGDWCCISCPIDASIDPEIKDGDRVELECGDALKNVMQTDDTLTGASVTLSLGVKNGEVEYIVAGSVGSVIYDDSSPPCAIGYSMPTLAEQANAVPFEMRLWQAEVDQSNETGFCCYHFYRCNPTFNSLSPGQKSYTTPEFSIDCVENPAYDGGKPVYEWEIDQDGDIPECGEEVNPEPV